MPSKQERLFEIPDWIAIEAWQGFEEMRNRQKKPMTQRARTCVVNTLWRMKLAGQDVTAILDQSTVNCWLDVFPLREERNVSTARKSRTQLAYEEIDRLDRLDRNDAAAKVGGPVEH